MPKTAKSTKFYLIFPDENKAYLNQQHTISQTLYYNRNKEKVSEYKKAYYTFKKQASIFRNILLD
jgi:hypothetical protein